MPLMVKFVLAVVGAVAIVTGTGAWHLYQLQRETFEAEARNRVELVLNFGTATRSFTSQTLSPAVTGATDELILEAMAPASTVRHLFDEFHALMPEYTYRSPSLDPMNPDDQATPLEAEIIRRFDRAFVDSSSLAPFSGYVSVDGEERFLIAQPVETTPTCLVCHGPRDSAPPIVRDQFDGGYDWPLDRIINGLFIYVPTADLQAHQANTIRAAAITFGVSTTVLILVVYWLFERLVSRRIRQIARVMDQTAGNPGSAAFLADQGKDEIGVVADAFNRMSRSLRATYGRLERTAAERGAALEIAKAEAEAARVGGRDQATAQGRTARSGPHPQSGEPS